MNYLNQAAKTLKQVMSTRAFATFWIVMVLFILLAPGMVLDITPDEIAKPQDWLASGDNMKNLLQVIPDLLTGKKPNLSGMGDVLMHSIVAGLIASQLVTLEPAKWGKKIGLGKVM